MKCSCCDKDVGAVPMDIGFAFPDDAILLLRAGEGGRIVGGEDESVCVIDPDDPARRRMFLRGLLEVPIPGTEGFRYGVWYEIDREAGRKVHAAWNDDAAWMALRIEARIGNDLVPYEQKAAGSKVILGAKAPGIRLQAMSCETPWIQNLIMTGWTLGEHHAKVMAMGLPGGAS